MIFGEGAKNHTRGRVSSPVKIRVEHPTRFQAPLANQLAAVRTKAIDFAMHDSGQLTVAEYFAGIGLMRLGLDQAGWSTVFANDIDRKKHEMYAHQFGHSPEFVLGDVHELDAKTVPKTLLATASFPCNDLSLAGSRRGLAGQHSSAFWGFMRILEEMGARRPPIILLENVAEFRRMVE